MISANASEYWYDLVKEVYENGRKVTCRGHSIREIVGMKSWIPMIYPLVTLKTRKLGYRFACAEAAWILSGDNKVDTIKPFSPMIESFSDDRISFFGAYGPKVIDQLEYINRALTKDLYSRQAVLTIWREKPPISNDIPCTISIQFLVRDLGNKRYLHLIDCMRSSDTWLGTPYDWFTFSMVGAYFCLYFKQTTGIELALGDLYFFTGSQHIYENSFGYSLSDIERVVKSSKTTCDFYYRPLDPYCFDSPQELIDHLWSLARNKTGLPGKPWLAELVEYWRNKSERK